MRPKTAQGGKQQHGSVGCTMSQYSPEVETETAEKVSPEERSWSGQSTCEQLPNEN